MSDNNENKEEAVKAEGLPPQQAPDDTANWDDRVTTSPDGEKNIRSTENEED